MEPASKSPAPIGFGRERSLVETSFEMQRVLLVKIRLKID
jgi:hypothetical protein